MKQDEDTIRRYRQDDLWARASTIALFDSGLNFGAILVKNIADLHTNHGDGGGTSWPVCGDTLAIKRRELAIRQRINGGGQP